MKKTYYFNSECYKARVVIAVDTDLFTQEQAKITLDFYGWNYDEHTDLIDEVVKKYALEALSAGLRVGYNLYGVKRYFNYYAEGFRSLSEKNGIDIIDFSIGRPEDDDLTLEEVKIKGE